MYSEYKTITINDIFNDQIVGTYLLYVKKSTSSLLAPT